MFATMRLFVTAAAIGSATFLAMADDEPNPSSKDKSSQTKQATAKNTPLVFRLPESLKLTDDQQAMLDELKAKHGPELRALTAKVQSVYTRQQRRARNRARKAAVADGKKGPEVVKLADAAAGLSEDQQKQLEETRRQQRELRASISKQVSGLLTREQRRERRRANQAKKKADKS